MGKKVEIYLKDYIHQIRDLMMHGQCQVTHCFMKANSMADTMDNVSVINKRDMFFIQALTILIKAKDCLKNDLKGYVYL